MSKRKQSCSGCLTLTIGYVQAQCCAQLTTQLLVSLVLLHRKSEALAWITFLGLVHADNCVQEVRLAGLI